MKQENSICSATGYCNTYKIQRLYHCKDCWPDDPSKVCCVACSEICHKNHDLIDCGICAGYCDCKDHGDCKCYSEDLDSFIQFSGTNSVVAEDHLVYKDIEEENNAFFVSQMSLNNNSITNCRLNPKLTKSRTLNINRFSVAQPAFASTRGAMGRGGLSRFRTGPITTRPINWGQPSRPISQPSPCTSCQVPNPPTTKKDDNSEDKIAKINEKFESMEGRVEKLSQEIEELKRVLGQR